MYVACILPILFMEMLSIQFRCTVYLFLYSEIKRIDETKILSFVNMFSCTTPSLAQVGLEPDYFHHTDKSDQNFFNYYCREDLYLYFQNQSFILQER